MPIVVASKAAAPGAAIKEGTYAAILTGIKQFQNTYGQRIGFEFTIDSGEKVMRSTAPQLTRQSKLAEVIEGMLGRELADKELREGFDVESLLDKKCSILVLQSKSKAGVVYSNVERVFSAR